MFRKSAQIAELERSHGKPIDAIVVDAINQTGNRSAAARALGVHVRTFHLWTTRFAVDVSTQARTRR